MQLYNHKFAWLLASLWLCCSCIDEFEADLPSTDMTYLVVEGSICGNTECEFILSRSLSLSPKPQELLDRYINDATVNVCASDGSKVAARFNGQGTYLASLSALDMTKEYWLEVDWDGLTFASDPAQPTQTPQIANITFEQPRPDEYVDFLITPAETSGNETQYFLWSYKEDWEIVTPYKTRWDFDAEKNAIVPASVITNRGWCADSRHVPVISSNADFVNGQIRNLKLYDVDSKDNRFNYLYRTTVQQRAITLEEYEYEMLSLRQSDDMGGLFTPQPTELPTNIHCQNGTRKAIGYVGVNYNVAQAQLYVRGKDVGYKLSRIAKEPSESELSRLNEAELYRLNYRIKEYDPMVGKITWIERWGVDCTVWGANIFARPDNWPNDISEIPSTKKE